MWVSQPERMPKCRYAITLRFPTAIDVLTTCAQRSIEECRTSSRLRDEPQFRSCWLGAANRQNIHPTEELARTEVETGSVHSLPVVQVTEPTSPAAPTPRSVSSTYPTSSTPSSLSANAPSSLDRRNRTRQQMDVSVTHLLPKYNF